MMTKTKKVATVAVSVVLAGTMVLSIGALTACSNKKDSKSSYTDLGYKEGTELNVAIGYSKADTGLFYDQSVGSGRTTIVGGYTAYNGGPKPATKAMQDALNIKFKNAYTGNATSSNLTELVNANTWGSEVDMATTDLTVAVTQANNGTVLNLADYLDYMPNFKAFLEENPIVYLSLLQSGMDTTTGEGQKLYVAPYFDGMDDIEKGCLMRQDWIVDVLDKVWNTSNNANNDTFKTACYAVTSTTASGENVTPNKTEADKTYATSYMGTTGSWTIQSTAEANDGTIVTVKKDYDAALSAAEGDGGSTSNGLCAAYTAIAGTAYSGDSGNIVDIMNSALASTENGAVGMDATGEQLATLYKAYIDAAYSVNGQQYYGTESVPYSKVFTGYSACWDVDDLCALLRIIKCSSGQVGLENGYKTVGIYPRDYTNSRTPDLISLVGELYGVRGATSRYENMYIDSNGDLQDARADVRFWEALEAFGGLAQEGLVDGGYILNNTNNSASSDYDGKGNKFLDVMHGNTKLAGSGFMQWDYSQTQTTQEFDELYDEDYLYGWVNTPVSRWDDGTYDTTEQSGDSDYSYDSEGYKYMRFTDSWRSTKTAGVAVAAEVAKDENKLAACLAFIDYLYSTDGQVTTTYAIQDTTGNSSSPNGTWWGTPVAASDVDSSAKDYTDLCVKYTNYVIKEEYKDEYKVVNGQICDLDGNATGLDLETYANENATYKLKEEYQEKCFLYGDTLYEGELYKGRMTPVVTDELYAHFTANSSDKENYVENAISWTTGSTRGSFTNFARIVLGSTLPICVKDQSFENQLTATIAKNEATKVSVSIANGTINHCSLTLTENMFYTCVPTGFPLSTDDSNVLSGSGQNQLRLLLGITMNDSSHWTIFHYIIWFGYTGTYSQNGDAFTFESSNVEDALGMVTYLGNLGLTTRDSILAGAWTTAKNYWTYLSK
ncbi:MAG: hypothetical protein LUD72_03165 [Bacteroidales bacterium]|nr:hypothetical protein [Bacteroidales bacterium]